MDRKYKITHVLDLTGQGLELGPLCWPVVTKAESRIYYVDHMSTVELKEKYKNEKVPLEEIVGVDYALGGKSLKETIGPRKKFDYVIASHVIEHIPDMVRWLRDIASVLKVGGRLSLVIPDKRFTFDINRHTSRAADVVGAYLDQQIKPSSASVFDFASEYILDVDANKAWHGETYAKGRHRYSLQDSIEMCRENQLPDTYVDTHCLVFTPVAFFEILRTLIKLDLLDFKVVQFFDTAENEYEFFVVLEKVQEAGGARIRLKSLPRLQEEPTAASLLRVIEEQRLSLQGLLTSRSWQLTKFLRQANSSISKLHKRKD